MSHVSELLADFVFGALSHQAERAVSAHLRACATCREEHAALCAACEPLAFRTAPIEPSSSLRARLMAAAEGKGRLAHLSDRLAEFLAITRDKALAALDAIDAAGAWEPGPFPGLGLIHLNAGPALALADTGLVRFPKGIDWPLHRHLGEDRMLILEGGIRESTGREHHVGAVVHSLAGSEHAFTVLPERDCVSAVILFEGIEMPPGNRLPL